MIIKSIAAALRLCLIGGMGTLSAQQVRSPDTAAVQFLNPSTVAKLPGLNQAAIVTSGKLVMLSGQVGLNARGEMVGADFEAQAVQAFENIKALLAASGVSTSNIVKLNYYVVGLDEDKTRVLRQVRDRYVNTQRPPVSTLAGVQALFRKDCLIEIEAVAIAP